MKVQNGLPLQSSKLVKLGLSETTITVTTVILSPIFVGTGRLRLTEVR